MAKLAYYASPVPGKKSWFQSDEGYRTYLNVQICRTGSQFYFGRELKKNAGYDSLWNLQDDQEYEVFRPLKEVTDASTIASSEGKSVLDQHPSDKVLIDALDEYDGISQGHQQNVRVGRPIPDGEFAGETPLIADLHIKNPELNLKIESGVREVSCGYRFILAKGETGRLIMTKIRGNHVAVVPRGRAGPEIAIGDAAPDVSPNSNETRKSMEFNSRLMRAIGIQNWCKNATPEQVADALDLIASGEDFDAPASNGTGDAWRYDPMSTDGSHEVFETPKPRSEDAFNSSANSWPKTTMTTTSPTDVYQRARSQAEQPDDEPNGLAELGLEDFGGAADSARTMDFYNGRNFADGRALENQSRIARGLAPLPLGRR